MKLTGIDIRPFCLSHPEKPYLGWDLASPWYCNGYWYATDGWICIRRRGRPGEYQSAEMFPRADRLRWRNRQTLRDLPAKPRTGTKPLEGKAIGVVFLDDFCIRQTHFAAIRRLPQVKYALRRKKHVMYFKFDDGQGLVMELLSAEGGRAAE